MKSKEQKVREATQRRILRERRTPAQQLAFLDKRPGESKRERARIGAPAKTSDTPKQLSRRERKAEWKAQRKLPVAQNL